MSNSVRGTRPIFAFLGVTNAGTDEDTNILQERLNKSLSECKSPVKFKRVGELLSISLVNPNFCFYVTLVKNENKELPDWADMAKNFGLKWDKRPVTTSRLQRIIEILERNGKPDRNVNSSTKGLVCPNNSLIYLQSHNRWRLETASMLS